MEPKGWWLRFLKCHPGTSPSINQRTVHELIRYPQTISFTLSLKTLPWKLSRSLLSTSCLFSLLVGVVVQLLSYVWLFTTPWTTAHQASLSFTISQSLLKLMSTESMIPSNHLILCRPLLLLPSIFQHQGLFQWVSSSHEVAKLWSYMNIQDWFPLGLTGLISSKSKGLSRVFSNSTVQKHQFFGFTY